MITTAPGAGDTGSRGSTCWRIPISVRSSRRAVAYTWGENAHEFRLTPWYNDPVSDSSGEALYLRDEETGQFWSPTSLPAAETMPYVSRHGFGYSVFEYTSGGIRSELWVYVAMDAAVKFAVLKVRNESGRRRRLSATGYVRVGAGGSAIQVAHARDHGGRCKERALFARNPYNSDFGGWTTFVDVDDAARTVTGDRTEFLGRNGTLRSPAAMTRSRLFGAGAGPGSLRRDASQLRALRRAGARDHLHARCRSRCRGCEQPGASVSGGHRRARRSRSGVAVLEPHSRRGPGRDTGRVPQCPGQRLAPVPDLWRAASGRAADTTSRAAPSASATSCRT